MKTDALVQTQPRKATRNATRRPGRPGRSSANQSSADQRSRLLDAAVALYARQGIAATPLNRIAREAEVTPALLHYYFGNREQLLDALVAERVLPLMANLLVQLQAGGGGPEKMVPTFVQVVMHTLAEHPWFPQLWAREILVDGGLLRERVLGNARLVAPLFRDRFAAAQEEGKLNPQLDSRLMVVSLIGLTIFPFAAQSIWRLLFAADDIDASALVKHTLALLERGLEAKP